MKRMIWFNGRRPEEMSKAQWNEGIVALAKAVGGEVVLFSKSTPEHEASFMIIGDEAAERKMLEISNNAAAKAEKKELQPA